MTRLDRDRPGAGPIVQAFSGTGFRVDGNIYPDGVKLTPRTALPWQAPAIAALAAADLVDLLALDPPPEFLLLGTGATLQRPSPTLIAALGIGVEVMDSRAAARAWGVLRAEDRWIAAALLPLDQR